MDLGNVSSKVLRKAIKLVEAKEAVVEQIKQIEAQIISLLGGSGNVGGGDDDGDGGGGRRKPKGRRGRPPGSKNKSAKPVARKKSEKSEASKPRKTQKRAKKSEASEPVHEVVEVAEEKPTAGNENEAPKKKRGRPAKVKTEVEAPVKEKVKRAIKKKIARPISVKAKRNENEEPVVVPEGVGAPSEEANV